MKHLLRLYGNTELPVAPHAGAWIETTGWW